MKLSIIAIAATALIASSPAFAAKVGAKTSAPGQKMQMHGSVAGSPGASGYAPGHLKKKAVVRSASKFAPGHVKNNVHVPVRATSGAAVRN